MWGSTPHSGRWNAGQPERVSRLATTNDYEQRLPACNMLQPSAPLSDLVPHPARGDDAECDQTKRGKPRRSVAEMQLEMANRGGFFIDFEVPTADPAGDPIAHTKEYKV